MKKILFWAVPCLLLTACSLDNVSQPDIEQIKRENDSIRRSNAQLESVISVFSGTLDSMAVAENLIFVDDKGNDVSDKEVVLNHLRLFRNQMSDYRKQIDALQKKLKGSNANSAKLQKVIANLKSQIEQKDKQIASMEQSLKAKDADIADLKTRLESESFARKEAEESRDFFVEVARANDELVNTGYYVIDTKKNLKSKGLASGMFKAKANYENLDTSLFTKIDVRDCTEIAIPSDSPKLVTEKPADSYTLAKTGDDTSVLRITDVAKFWEASPFLIIQL